jgi:hypothetical protein
MRFAVLLAFLVAATRVSAQPCAGDCNGDGMVRVDEMIVGVRIALGESVIADCPAFDANGDGTLAIDELVRGVTSILGGCPAMPSATPTATPSETPSSIPTVTDTAAPTATPTIPPVAGAWVEQPLAVDESSCAEELTSAFSDELSSRGPCSQQVEVTGETTVRVTDCSQQIADGSLDRDGTIHLDFAPSHGFVGGCTVTLSISSVIAAGATPVTAHYTFGLVFGGTCRLDDCAIQASAAWARVE